MRFIRTLNANDPTAPSRGLIREDEIESMSLIPRGDKAELKVRLRSGAERLVGVGFPQDADVAAVFQIVRQRSGVRFGPVACATN